MEELDEIIKQINDEFGEGTITTANEAPRPQSSLDRDAFDDFNKRNPMAGGGMLVQPNLDGSRPEYAPKKGHKEQKAKLLNWLNNNKDTFDFANSSSGDVLKASKVDLGVGAVQKLLSEQGIKTKTAIAKTQDRPKYTKKVLEELREGLPRGISLEQTRPGQYYFKVLLKGKKVNKPNVTKSMVANETNKKEIINFFNKKVKEYYPGRITDDEFKKLRLEKKDMTTEQFSKFLNSKNKTTYLGEKWNKASVSTLQNRLNIGVGTTGPLVKRTVEEARAIINQYPGAKFFYLQNPSDSEITRYAADLVSQEKTGAKGGKKGFPVGSTKENKMFRNFYDSSLKPNGRMQLITKIPTDADGRINWKKKDANGIPEWKKAKFFDKKTGATFSWGAKYKPGDLAKQVDAAYGQGFFAKSVKVYDEQAAINKQKFKGKALNEIFREGLLKKELEIKLDRPLTNSKADQKLLQEFYALRKPSFSFTEAHHIEGVGENPFRMELSYRAANRKQNNLLNSFKAGNITKAEYITGMENLADTKGGIRFKTDGRFIGEAATPETIIKAAAQDIDMKPLQVEKMLATFSNNPKCIITFGKAKAAADGGRIGYQTGTVSLSECAKDGAKNFQDGKFKTADQVQDAAKLLSGGRRVLSGLMKYGIIPELAFVGLEATGRSILGEKPLNAIKKSIDTFTFGLTDFTSGIEAEKFGKFGDLKLDVDKYRNSLAKVNSIQQDIANLEALNTGSDFGYEGDQTEAIQIKRAQLEAAKKELQQNMISPDKVSVIDRMADNIADAQMAKSAYAKASAKDQMIGIPGVSDYMDTDQETARVFPRQPSQVELNLNMLPSFQDYQKSDAGKVDKTIMNAPDEVLKEISPDALEMKKALQEAYKMENLKDIYGAEQIYGTQGVFSQPLAGGGIAKLAGVDQGPPPESGPNSQGLQGLMKRVKNI